MTAELDALSPLDGRYRRHTEALRPYFSEAALIRYRIRVEWAWLRCLSQQLPQHFSPSDQQRLAAPAPVLDPAQVKALEAVTNHDVKAVEYAVAEWLKQAQLGHLVSWLHFAATSEDINNLAYALMLFEAREQVLLPALNGITQPLHALAHAHASTALLARTHGQSASPTTVGKELANVLARLERLIPQLETTVILGKFNGASGNFNAHHAAFPDLDWAGIAQNFIRSLGLVPNTMTTQIEPHDWIAELCHSLMRVNTVLIDLCRDVWGYIALGHLGQKSLSHEVGSSTMPHKINPIDFENAEGNLGLANALLAHFADKLPISRWQRDLSDSTVLRNIGSAWGYALLSYTSLNKGLGKLKVNTDSLLSELENNPQVITEAIQTILRREGIADAYEQLKALSRGNALGLTQLQQWITALELSPDVQSQLLSLRPETYTGLAEKLTRDYLKSAE